MYLLDMAQYSIDCGKKAYANTFGALYVKEDKPEKDYRWFGPNVWYMSVDEWTYDYHLHDTGIMSSPVFEIR